MCTFATRFVLFLAGSTVVKSPKKKLISTEEIEEKQQTAGKMTSQSSVCVLAVYQIINTVLNACLYVCWRSLTHSVSLSVYLAVSFMFSFSITTIERVSIVIDDDNDDVKQQHHQ